MKNKKSKVLLLLYILLVLISIIVFITELISNKINNLYPNIVFIITLSIPIVLKKLFKLSISKYIEISFILFSFLALVLGEGLDFYEKYKIYDIIMHIICGFISASIGYALLILINKKKKETKSLLIIFSLCFSMTIGIFWEFIEYSLDNVLWMNTQKQTIIHDIKSLHIKDIDKTIIHYDNNKIKKINGYIDIGLNDTINDLFVNLIGAISFILYYYIMDKNKPVYQFRIEKEK